MEEWERPQRPSPFDLETLGISQAHQLCAKYKANLPVQGLVRVCEEGAMKSSDRAPLLFIMKTGGGNGWNGERTGLGSNGPRLLALAAPLLPNRGTSTPGQW